MGEDSENKTSIAPAVRVGLIAAAGQAGPLVAAISDCAELELAAQSDVPQSAVAGGAEWFDDRRVLLARAQVQAVVLAISPRVDAELSLIAADHGVGVWRAAPLGRSFAEAIEVVRRASAASAALRVGSWWDHVREVVRWALAHAGEARPIFSELRIAGPGPGLDSPWSSAADSGGGVLACDAYWPLEALIATRGLPATVFAATGRRRGSASGTPRETEDIAAALLRLEDGGFAQVTAAWDAAPHEQQLIHHTPAGLVRQTMREATFEDDDGRTVERRALPAGYLATEMRRLAAEVRTPATRESGRETIARHVAVSAVLEAAYLSARTGQPETPRQLLEAQGWSEAKR